MPQKKSGKGRFRAVIVSGILCAVMLISAGCSGNKPETKSAPPVPHKLTDIALRESGVSLIFTPTSAVSPGPGFTPTPTARETDLEGTQDTAPPPIGKKEPGNIAEGSPNGTSGPPEAGEFTIQIGAYIVDENLAHTREKIVSLGFSPYIKEMKQKMRMFCVIVKEGVSEKDANEAVSLLAAKGFNPRSLPGTKGMVDVAAGIYYYRDDALAEEASLKALGYAPRVEERTVEVYLKRLRVGGYGTIGEAKKDLTVLERKGFLPVILKSGQ